MIRALDIFSGLGGSSCGARLAGVEVAAAIDGWSLATQAYRANFPDATVICARVESVCPSKLVQETGPIDLLLASPECTNHSCGKGNAPRNESSKETAFQVVRFAKALRPRWLVIENVVNMRPWPRYQTLVQEIRDLGYFVREEVIDASSLGVAQTRKRLFLLCDLECPVPPMGLDGAWGPRARDILDPPGTWAAGLLYRPNRAAKTLERAARGFSALGAGASFLVLHYSSDGAGGWQSLDRPLRTITTLDRFGLVEPGPEGPTLRMLQPPELKRAMGFPASYEITQGTRRDRIKLIGNAVCPPVMQYVVSHLTGQCALSRIQPERLN